MFAGEEIGKGVAGRKAGICQRRLSTRIPCADPILFIIKLMGAFVVTDRTSAHHRQEHDHIVAVGVVVVVADIEVEVVVVVVVIVDVVIVVV